RPFNARARGNMPGAPLIFDRELLRVRQARARKLGPVTFLVEQVAQDLVERLRAVLRTFPIAVDLGTPGDALQRALAHEVAIGRLVSMQARAGEADCAVVADEEMLP